ncbi:MAG: four helix bundle protein [Chitinophagaceae bacterium]|nr:four helix bundle protein [Chitinophagaceae bacterium]
MSKGLRLEELEVYKVAMEIGEMVWKIVLRWDHFARQTLGSQFVRAADSVAFNISEGYGRFHFKENKNFCYYSRGSAKETTTAAVKAQQRSLISDEEFNTLNDKLQHYFRLMNGYINSIGSSGSDPGQ